MYRPYLPAANVTLVNSKLGRLDSENVPVLAPFSYKTPEKAWPVTHICCQVLVLNVVENGKVTVFAVFWTIKFSLDVAIE